MTLVEVLIALGLSALVLTALASFSFYSSRSFVAMGNYVDLDHYSRTAIDHMSQEIRQTRGLTSFSTNSLTFLDADGTDLTYTYNAGAKTLHRIKGAQSELLLDECDYLKFEMYQRTPQNGSYNLFPAATVATAKLIQVTWICSRKIMQQRANTETVQSAKIVIRKKEV